MAILNFIFGGIWLVMLVCSGVILVVASSLVGSFPRMPNAPDPTEQMTVMVERIPGFVPFTVVSLTLGVLVCLLLIVSGVGLLKMRLWGRWLCVAYACLSILYTLMSTVFTLVFYNPVMAEYQQEVARKYRGAVTTSPEMLNAVSVVAAVAYLVYPVVILIVMFLPSVSAAFAGWNRPPREAKDDRGGYDDEGAGVEERGPPDDRFRKRGGADD
jgi:hypothetical protein